MYKFFIALLIFFSSFLSVYAQIPDFPPELQWWICEIQKADSSIEVSEFLLIDKREIEYAREDEYLVEKYPVFRKWNYFGDKYGYYDITTELVKTKEGKYIVYRDIDSVFAVFNRDGNLLFCDSFGSQSVLNGFAWSRDNIVIAVGIEVISDAGENVNLIVLRYIMNKDSILVERYVSKIRIRNEDRIALKIEWWNQRPDYFEQ